MNGSTPESSTPSCHRPSAAAPNTSGATTVENRRSPRGRPRRVSLAVVSATSVSGAPPGPPSTAGRRGACSCCARGRRCAKNSACVADALGAAPSSEAGTSTTSTMRPGPRRHHHDPVGEEDRLGDRVGHEQHRGAGLAADPDQLVLHPLAGDLVEGAERLVHQQQPRAARPGRGRSRRAAACRRRAGRGGSWRSRRARRARAARRRGPCARRRRRRAARAAARRCRRRCATAAARPAGRRCRSPGRVRGLAGRLAEDRDGAGGRGVEVGDQAQQGALAAAAGPDQRDELARRDLRSTSVRADDLASCACRRPARPR